MAPSSIWTPIQRPNVLSDAGTGSVRFISFKVITEQLLPAIMLTLSQSVCCLAASGTLSGMPVLNRVEGKEPNFEERL